MIKLAGIGVVVEAILSPEPLRKFKQIRSLSHQRHESEKAQTSELARPNPAHHSGLVGAGKDVRV